MVRNIVRSDRQSAFEASRASSAPSKRPRSPSDHSSIEARSDAASNGLGLGFVARARAASKPRARGVDARERVLRTARRIVVCEVAANIVRVECVYDAARRDTPYRYENENERARSISSASRRWPNPRIFYRNAARIAMSSRTVYIHSRDVTTERARRDARRARRRRGTLRRARSTSDPSSARGVLRTRAKPRASSAAGVEEHRNTPIVSKTHTRGRSAATARVNEDGARGSDEEILRHARGGDRR